MAATSTTTSSARELWPRLRDWPYRNEAIAILVIVAAMYLMPRGMPKGLFALGGIGAAGLLLHATATVLVFRANRFINFVQLQLSVFAATVFTALVQGQILLDLVRTGCGCVSREPAGTSVVINWVLAVVIAIGVAAGLSFGFYATVLRRFTRSPRLMLTLFTVFAGQTLAGFESDVRDQLVGTSDSAKEQAARIPTNPPVDFEWEIDAVAHVSLGDLLLVVMAVVLVLAVVMYFRKSQTGVAIRAAAESPARAQTLGVDVVSVTSRVWLIAGVFAGVAGVVGVWGGNVLTGADSGIPVDQLMLILAVVVLAQFRSIPMVAVGALLFGMLRVTVQHGYGSRVPLDAALFVIVGGLLLLQQRSREGRAERDDVAQSDLNREARPIPRELRHLPQVKSAIRYGFGFLAIVVLGLPWVLSGGDTTEVTTYLIFSIIGLSLLVLTGWAGQVSLGQFGFAAIGGWVAAVSGLPMPLALLVGAAAGGVAAFVVGLPALKLRGFNLAITTLAFAFSARAIFVDERFLGQSLPADIERPSVLGMDFDDPRVFYYFIVIVVVAVAVAVAGLRRSRTGRTLIAVRSNEATAEAFGINVLRLRLTAFAISGVLAAFAGGLFLFLQRGLTPEAIAADRSLKMFMFSVIGGLGGIAGSFFGFAFMGILEFFHSNPVVRYAAEGTGAMLLLLAAPGGLSQVFYDARDGALRRLAVRLRIPVPSLAGDRAAASVLDRAQLDGDRTRSKAGSLPPLRYKLPNQWALDGHGELESRPVRRISEPMGAGND